MKRKSLKSRRQSAVADTNLAPKCDSNCEGPRNIAQGLLGKADEGYSGPQTYSSGTLCEKPTQTPNA